MDERSYTPGLKSASGSCNVWYHDDDPAPLLSRVIQAGAATDSDIVRLSLRWGQKKIDVDAPIFSDAVDKCGTLGVYRVPKWPSLPEGWPAETLCEGSTA